MTTIFLLFIYLSTRALFSIKRVDILFFYLSQVCSSTYCRWLIVTGEGVKCNCFWPEAFSLKALPKSVSMYTWTSIYIGMYGLVRGRDRLVKLTRKVEWKKKRSMPQSGGNFFFFGRTELADLIGLSKITKFFQ